MWDEAAHVVAHGVKSRDAGKGNRPDLDVHKLVHGIGGRAPRVVIVARAKRPLHKGVELRAGMCEHRASRARP